jgi:cytosine/adenosine deaminase-related metal-dependent hydrolase
VIVEGVILDADGPRPGYVRFDHGHVVETGQLGTESAHGRVPRRRGIVVPPLVNSHTHLADGVWEKEPPHEPVERLVAGPQGLKFRLLNETASSRKRSSIRGSLRQMVRGGISAVIDFREEGRRGVELLRQAAEGIPIRVVALGRPLDRPVQVTEVDRLLEIADGIGLSSGAEVAVDARRVIAERCRVQGKRYALHASEVHRESPEEYLSPRPDLLIHLTEATLEDLQLVAEAGATAAVCPRSNALFGRRPDFQALRTANVRVLLGTDNAMFQSPSMWRELEFAYHSARLMRRPVPPEFLFRAAFVNPWEWLGTPRMARIEAGSEGDPIILRLPIEDPYYQVVVRGTEHLMSRAGTPGA